MAFFQKFKSIETLIQSMMSAFLVKDLDLRGEALYLELFEPGFGIGLPGWCFGRIIRGTQEVDASVVILWLDLVMLSYSGSNLDSGLFDNLFDDHRGNHAARRVSVPRSISEVELEAYSDGADDNQGSDASSKMMVSMSESGGSGYGSLVRRMEESMSTHGSESRTAARALALLVTIRLNP